MKSNLIFFVLAVAVLSVSGFAQDIYDNGPTNGTTDGWTINFGFSVSDSFTLTGGADVEGLNFAAWMEPGDVLETAEVSFTSSEFGGTSYFDQTVRFTQSGCVSNQYGFNVCTESGAMNGPSLNAGTYWLNLSNAATSAGNPIYWDENSGPSSASENSIGTIPSESFSLEGACGAGKNSPDCGPPPTTPEPNSLLLLGSGCGVLLGFLVGLRKLF